jgi:starch-binding outer membrane protein, SusD/RagB family
MKRLKRHTLVGLVVLVGAASGCESFLDDAAAPQGALDELTLANRAGLEGTLVGAYRMLGGNTNWGSAPSNWALASVTSDDAYKGSEPSDQPAINPIEIYQWSVNFGYPNEKWSASFEGVQRSNATLRLLRAVEAKAGELTEAQARSIRGEALFLRAHYHFEAYRVFKNIPYYTEDDTDFRKPNVEAAEVIRTILADLDAAIAVLPATARNGQRGRATAWTARAYKGRVQMYARDFAGALATLRNVAQNGPYQLQPSYNQVWSALVSNGPETIWAYQASVNDGTGDGENGNYGERLNFPHSGSPFGCCGFHQPSQNLVNFFRVDDNGLPLAISVGDLTPLSASAAWNANNENFIAGNMAPVDPRLDWTVGRDGVPYKDWGVHAPNWIRQAEYGGPYSAKKHVHEKSSGLQSTVGWNAQHLNGTNIHLFRYADLLLMLAEAEVEVGSLENARQIVNQIRARAAVAAQGPGTTAANMAVPLNDPSITWATYRIGQYPSFPSQDYARTAVRYERRLELAFEGQRLFDLQRWNEYAPVLNEYITVEKTRRPHLTAAAPVTDRHQYFPIPPVQIDLSRVGGESRLRQNPGW